MLGLLAGQPTPTSNPVAPDWERWVSLPGVVDVVGPRPDGAMVAAAAGRLFLVREDGTTAPFGAPALEGAQRLDGAIGRDGRVATGSGRHGP